MVRHGGGKSQFAPLIVLRVPLCAPHKLYDSMKFNLRFPDPSKLTRIADKLRWYRYHKGLLQRDVARYLNLYRSTYNRYESNERDFYPMEHLQALAALYGVPLAELMDDYHAFVYNGQGQQIKQKRNLLHLTQKAYAKQLGVSLCHLKRWEQDAVRVSRQMWEKCFRE